MRRKSGFGVKFRGVGGREVQVPIASFWLGGVVGRRDRRVEDGEVGCVCAYCIPLLVLYLMFGLWKELTMCGLSDSVETGLDAPRRKSVGVRKPGRMERVERTNVVESIVKLSRR
jgi:hypothetical protein